MGQDGGGGVAGGWWPVGMEGKGGGVGGAPCVVGCGRWEGRASRETPVDSARAGMVMVEFGCMSSDTPRK